MIFKWLKKKKTKKMTDDERIALMLYVEMQFAWRVPSDTPKEIARAEYIRICREAAALTPKSSKEILWKI